MCPEPRPAEPIREARCSCGQLTATTRGEPVRVAVCHCHACQRRTGNVFGTQARFPRDQVDIRGESTVYTRIADSGQPLHYHFCPSCGATVYYFLEQLPEVIALPVGVFADDAFPEPALSIYEARRHPWVQLPEHWEHHE